MVSRVLKNLCLWLSHAGWLKCRCDSHCPGGWGPRYLQTGFHSVACGCLLLMSSRGQAPVYQCLMSSDQDTGVFVFRPALSSCSFNILYQDLYSKSRPVLKEMFRGTTSPCGFWGTQTRSQCSALGPQAPQHALLLQEG